MIFKADGKQFRVSIDALAIKEVRKAAAFSLEDKTVPVNLNDTLHIIGLGEYVDTLTDTLLVLCRESIKENGLSQEAFAKLIRGEVIEGAAGAVVEAALDFFHGNKKSEIATCWSMKAQERKQAADLLAMRPELAQAATRKLKMNMQQLIQQLTSDSPTFAGNRSASNSLAAMNVNDSLGS